MGYNNNNATWNEPTLPEHVDGPDVENTTAWLDDSADNNTIAFVKLDPPESLSDGGVVVDVKQLSPAEDTIAKLVTKFEIQGTIGDDLAAIKVKPGLPVGYIWTGSNFRHPNK